LGIGKRDDDDHDDDDDDKEEEEEENDDDDDDDYDDEYCVSKPLMPAGIKRRIFYVFLFYTEETIFSREALELIKTYTYI
jgi:hypothetical protein